MRAAPALALAACLICGGCGGGRRLSEAVFRARANAVCHALNRQSNSAPTTKRMLDTGLARIDAGLGRLRRLRPPARDERTYKDLLERIANVVAIIRGRGTAIVESERALHKEAAKHGTSKRLKLLVTRENTLVGDAMREGNIGARDALALHLDACASGIGSG